jgi:tRNA threonylcarbamoyladenosine biosynthesis protein TsaE
MCRETTLATAEDTRRWGGHLARVLAAGDLVVLTGELGAGKTTLTQGLAEGLGVRGPVTSPTFVIARVHPSLVGGPDLVHVDAYRLGGFAELDDLDLDASLDDAVTVVEWGHGLAEGLAEDYLEITLHGDPARTVAVSAHGPRWAEPGAAAALDALASLA